MQLRIYLSVTLRETAAFRRRKRNGFTSRNLWNKAKVFEMRWWLTIGANLPALWQVLSTQSPPTRVVVAQMCDSARIAETQLVQMVTRRSQCKSYTWEGYGSYRNHIHYPGQRLFTQMFKLATDSERKYRGTGYGKTVQPVPMGCIGIRVCEGVGGVICYPILIVHNFKKQNVRFK